MFRLNVTSRKLTILLFASMVMLRPHSLKIHHSFFFRFSVSLGVFVMMPRPSSLYSPRLHLVSFLILWSRYNPTSSHTSAPSNEPIVTSNILSSVFFFQLIQLEHSGEVLHLHYYYIYIYIYIYKVYIYIYIYTLFFLANFEISTKWHSLIGTSYNHYINQAGMV